jgi:hypothetical protein
MEAVVALMANMVMAAEGTAMREVAAAVTAKTVTVTVRSTLLTSGENST